LYNGLKPLLTDAIDTWIAIGTSAFGALIIGAIITVAVELIVSAIIGAIERDKLTEELQKVQQAYDTFDPASRQYTITINKVAARIDIYFEDHPVS
jgi:hypothetical protein